LAYNYCMRHIYIWKWFYQFYYIISNSINIFIKFESGFCIKYKKRAALIKIRNIFYSFDTNNFNNINIHFSFYIIILKSLIFDLSSPNVIRIDIKNKCLVQNQFCARKKKSNKNYTFYMSGFIFILVCTQW